MGKYSNHRCPNKETGKKDDTRLHDPSENYFIGNIVGPLVFSFPGYHIRLFARFSRRLHVVPPYDRNPKRLHQCILFFVLLVTPTLRNMHKGGEDYQLSSLEGSLSVHPLTSRRKQGIEFRNTTCYYSYLEENMSREGEVTELIIPELTPSLSQRGDLWFEKNKHRIRSLAKKEGFWKEHTEILEVGMRFQLSGLLRKLDDLGYEKTRIVTHPGEFSLTGGILRIAPFAMRITADIDFLGNRIESIRTRVLSLETHELRKHEQDLQRKLNRDSLRNLKPGDYLVHLDHGIGKFREIIHETSGNYYILEYAEGDMLWVPVGLEKKLGRYIGFKDPRISRLGSPLWERTKRKIRADAEKFARELLLMYAKREVTKRPPYPENRGLEKSLAADFGFEETEDQLLALEDINRDFSQESPMDRILCGDVGFGKTEVALRAAFRASFAGKQVALISPTTLLAWQHYQTCKERLRSFPVRLALLSRTESKREQKHTLEDLRAGAIDMVIGTHRLLSKDVVFKNLGLVIIDEEQRFGVKQKEHFKKLRAETDILSLSATPIPRTLYFALSGLRSISTIQSPPPGRLPIETHVLAWKRDVVRTLIQKEIERGGQVYVLYNRVETIELMRRDLETLLPRIRMGTIHGKLPEKKLIETMEAFRKKKIQVLVATTIIENGLDFPNVNTLIVRDASRLGLAQAYQIRGRIGRSHIPARAYFFYPARKLKGKALERLTALKEAEELGSGYQIALRDLEIRGAGNILGKEQSGAINKIGLNLYCQILAQATQQLKNVGEEKLHT